MSEAEDANERYDVSEQANFWRKYKSETAHLLKQTGDRTVKRMLVADLLADWRKLRKQGGGRCRRCNGHPHCGVWGHQEDECLLGKRITDTKCATCTLPLEFAGEREYLESSPEP